MNCDLFFFIVCLSQNIVLNFRRSSVKTKTARNVNVSFMKIPKASTFCEFETQMSNEKIFDRLLTTLKCENLKQNAS